MNKEKLTVDNVINILKEEIKNFECSRFEELTLDEFNLLTNFVENQVYSIQEKIYNLVANEARHV